MGTKYRRESRAASLVRHSLTHMKSTAISLLIHKHILFMLQIRGLKPAEAWCAAGIITHALV